LGLADRWRTVSAVPTSEQADDLAHRRPLDACRSLVSATIRTDRLRRSGGYLLDDPPD